MSVKDSLNDPHNYFSIFTSCNINWIYFGTLLNLFSTYIEPTLEQCTTDGRTELSFFFLNISAISASSLRLSIFFVFLFLSRWIVALFFYTSRIVHSSCVLKKKLLSLALREKLIICHGIVVVVCFYTHPPLPLRFLFPLLTASHSDRIMVSNGGLGREWSMGYKPERIRRNVSVCLVTLKLEGMTECSRYSPRII